MLSIRSLAVGYKEKEILHTVSIDVAKGEIFAVVGPNGSGKSTLVKAASGILPIKEGDITFDGLDLTHLAARDRARVISVVPQATQLGGAFTVEQTVLLGRTAFMGWLGVAGAQDQQRIDWALKLTGLSEFSERRIADLSGGEQQRVLVARALAQDCPIMFLDEPTSHLDLQHQINVLKLVRTLAKENNLVILITLHDLNMAALFADRVALLVDGHIKAMGSPKEVLTETNINAAYGTQVEVSTYAKDGRTLILPV